jgi:ABC-type multidrug transport system fused ATPase/permease subunit
MRSPGRGIDECCLRLLPGKSTLALVLLRLIPTEGKVFIDGIATDKINLNALRSSITIIPQDPTL